MHRAVRGTTVTMDDLRELLKDHLKSKMLLEDNPAWIVAKSKLGGRGLFAARDIQPGETIFKDNPLIVGPRVSMTSPTICVNCYERANLRACSRNCGLPVCSERCENSSSHLNECHLLLEWKNGLEFSDVQLLLFKCLTPVRSLLLNDDQKALLMLLKAHFGPLHGLEVDILKNKFKFQFSEDEEKLMRHTCSVLNANSFEVTVGNEENQASLRGLYPLSSLMNHSCVANTTHIFNHNQTMIVKASILIPKGHEIFDSYTRVYWATSVRRPHLATTKNFFCRCVRCEDPTEFGTNLSAINCLQCPGLVFPFFEASGKMLWKCLECRQETKAETAGMIISVLGASLECFQKSSSEPDDILTFLRVKLPKHLPLSSQIAVELKYKLVWIIGHRPKYLWKDVSLELLNEKETMCRELLQLLATLGVGQSKMRGLLLFELYSCLKERQRRVAQTDKSIDENDLKEMERLFQESREILGEDVHAPQEIKLYNSMLSGKGTPNEEMSLAG